MKTVRISKSALVALIEKSLAEHETEHAHAHAAWIIEQTKALRRAIARLGELPAQPSGAFALHEFSKPRPESHADDYRRALRMLALETREEVELDEAEFAQYVDDEWSWKRSFKAIAATYAGAK